MRCSPVTGRQSTLGGGSGGGPQSKSVEHGPPHTCVTVPKKILQGSVVVVVVAVGQQSCGHVKQSSEGSHSPSPHAQLQGGDPPLQLQRPAMQSAMNSIMHAPIASP